MNEAVKHIRYGDGGVALFEIDPSLSGGWSRRGIIVMSELRCTPESISFFNKPWTSLEEIQEKLGNRLKLEGKTECELLKRHTICKYSFEYGEGSIILAFPATGEEFCFEIYSIGNQGQLNLQYHREL